MYLSRRLVAYFNNSVRRRVCYLRKFSVITTGCWVVTHKFDTSSWDAHIMAVSLLSNIPLYAYDILLRDDYTDGGCSFTMRYWMRKTISEGFDIRVARSPMQWVTVYVIHIPHREFVYACLILVRCITAHTVIYHGIYMQMNSDSHLFSNCSLLICACSCDSLPTVMHHL